MNDQATRHLRGIDRTLRASALGVCLLIAIWVLRDILLLAFAAVLMACLLRGASGFLQSRTGAGAGLSLLTVVVVAIFLLGVLLWWRGTAIADQASQMVTQLTNQAQRLWEQLGTSAWGALLARQLRGAAELGQEWLQRLCTGRGQLCSRHRRKLRRCCRNCFVSRCVTTNVRHRRSPPATKGLAAARA